MTIKSIVRGLILLCVLSVSSFAEPYHHQLEQTTTNLGIAGEYTSTVFEISRFETINVNATSNVDSATSGLKINYVNVFGDCSDFTPASSNMDYTANGSGWTYTASGKESYESSVRGNCAWVTYTNGSTGQTSFKLTIFGNLK